MTTQTASPDLRWQEITTIWRDNRWLFVIAGMLLGILLTPAIEQITGDLNALIGNLVPEAIGIVFTVLILDTLAENRVRIELKNRLMNEVRSSASATAVTALDWLRRENWIDENTFKGKTLININWEGAYVGNMNLEGAILWGANFKNTTNEVIEEGNLQDLQIHLVNLANANLSQTNLMDAKLRYADLTDVHGWRANLTNAYLYQGKLIRATLREASLIDANLGEAILTDADLRQANLTNAYLEFSNLTNANLSQSNLTGAKLAKANLMNANLRNTNLMNANLRDTNLMNANIQNTNFDKKTILPDAEGIYEENGESLRDDAGNVIFTKYWTPDTDMSRYTNPEHPDFWQPEWAKEQHSYG